MSVRFLGLELVTIEASTDEADGDGPGEATSYPVGFTPSHGDQRHERGVDLE